MTTLKRLNQQEMIQAIRDRVKIVSPKQDLKIVREEQDDHYHITGYIQPTALIVLFDDVKEGSGSSIVATRRFSIFDNELDTFVCSLFPDEWFIETEADE